MPLSIASSSGPDALLLCPGVALRRLGCCVFVQTESGSAPVYVGTKPDAAERVMNAVGEALEGDLSGLRMLPVDANAVVKTSRLMCRRYDVLLVGQHGVFVVTSGNTLHCNCLRVWSELAVLHFLDVPRVWDSTCALVLERLLRFV